MRFFINMLFFAFILLLSATVFAEVAPVGSASHVPLTVWSGGTIIVLMLAAWALRAFTPDKSWPHSKEWSLAAPMLSAIITASIQAVTSSGLNTVAIMTAVI